MNNVLEEYARRGELVVMAGAGISAGRPTSLPGWKPLNEAIMYELRLHLESFLEKPDWLAEVDSFINVERNENRFPPEYQAQLIEEMCGDRYFRALQSLDIDVVNSGHDGIAALAAAGALKAVVTTNFDRLIEQSLHKYNVDYVVAYDDDTFANMYESLQNGGNRALPVIKIHGCVGKHLSMIDTLKQRYLGRSQHIEKCLSMFQSYYWLYLGFSAADLEGNRDYLGLVAGAVQSAGATYIAYPGNPALGEGAKLLMNAYGHRGDIVVENVAPVLKEICSKIGVAGSVIIPEDRDDGLVRFNEKLRFWAESLSPAATGLCLAAVLEAAGQAEAAVRILDRMVRKEPGVRRDVIDYQAVQLHYGRLGAAYGRFIAVPDLQGLSSNASVETVQSLLRLRNTELWFVASGWLACVFLGLNMGTEAIGKAALIMNGFIEGRWDEATPRTDEEIVDAWLSAAQVLIVNSHNTTIKLVLITMNEALEYAKRTGDMIRTARVISLGLLALSETGEDLPSISNNYQNNFEEAERVADGFAIGIRLLALGRWYVGVGGLALSQKIGNKATAEQALDYLQQALSIFRKQGMDLWEPFVLVQEAKAYADLHNFEEAETCLVNAEKGLERFPIWESHVAEAAGEIYTMCGDKEQAKNSFRIAAQAAGDSGLNLRREMIEQSYINRSE